jgi:hypothetical protein
VLAAMRVHDTPDGASAYTIDWCPPLTGNLFGLRHSLYNNPAAVKKIITHILDVCATAGVENSILSDRPYTTKKSKLLPLTAATLFVATLYAAAVLVAYAPTGAVGARCALGYYLEPAASKGRFSILVARFAADNDAVAEKTIETIRQTYGLPVIQTCLYVTENKEDKSFAQKLLTSYGASLAISGRSTKKGSELQFDTPTHLRETIALPAGADEETIAKRLDIVLARSISEWSQEVTLALPADNLADSAARIETFSSRIDWSKSTPNDEADVYLRLNAHIDFEAGVGRLLTVAALATQNGEWAKKAIEHFKRATALFNASANFKNRLREFWKNNYHEALLADARFSKSPESAQLAAAIYAEEYDIAFASRVTSALDVHDAADMAASAAWALYEINHNDDRVKTTSRFACLSLYWLKRYAADFEERMRPGDPLAKQGLQNGILRKPPEPERSQGYAALKAIKKDPDVIMALHSTIRRPDDCNNF